MTSTTYEVNFDGLIGPTHNYAGLSSGNLASMKNAGMTSNPRAAALEGLNKMKMMADFGFKQAILPPHERPHLPTFRALGFHGADNKIPEKVFKNNPKLLFQYASAADMFAANSASVTPSVDASNNRVHLTPANKSLMPHRAIEAEMTSRIFKVIFSNRTFFVHHPPQPHHPLFLDEGAANHIRFSFNPNDAGVHLFVSGPYNNETAKKYPSRQTRGSIKAIARSHRLSREQVVFAEHTFEALNHGVFHNDVISMGTADLFIYHEKAFTDSEGVIKELRQKFAEICGKELIVHRVSNEEMSLENAVKSYFFNSQVVKLPDGAFVLFCPEQCKSNSKVNNYIEKQLDDNQSPIADVHYVNLNQCMLNGGGPACMRLPMTLTDSEIEQVLPNVFLTNRLYDRLSEWINTHYRESLVPKDLADPHLVDEVQTALEQLTHILNLGHLYDFQR